MRAKRSNPVELALIQYVKNIFLFLFITLPGAAFIYLITKTIRISIQNKEYAFKDNQMQKAVYVLWHNRLFLLTGAFCFKNLCALISQSKDGEIIARIAKVLGYQAIRGSASRGGAQAVLSMLKQQHNMSGIVLTVDGSRGPRYEVKPGAIYLASKTGLPIIPVSYTASRKKELNSWDRFIVPLPFSKATISFAKPIFVPGDVDKEKIDEYVNKVKQELSYISLES